MDLPKRKRSEGESAVFGKPSLATYIALRTFTLRSVFHRDFQQEPNGVGHSATGYRCSQKYPVRRRATSTHQVS